MLDILIKNGTIIDGSGKKSFQSDIGIEKGFITEIGNLQSSSAAKIIDAQNMLVCPGFIDILSRSDAFGMLSENPSQESLIRQGITTIIGGNCGASLAPIISAHAINAIQKWADIKNVALNWSTMGEYLDDLSKRKIGINYGTLIGHTTLRRGLLKQDVRQLQSKELEQMQYAISQSMSEGALGLSAGLVYAHTKIAPTEELIEIARTASKYKGYFSLHVRNEGADMMSSVNEAIRISQEAQLPVEIAHFKIIGQKNWGLLEKVLNMIEVANRSGAQVTFDVFPYIFSASVLYTILPDWVTKEGKEKMLEYLRSAAYKKQIVEDMQKNQQNIDYENIIIAMSAGDKNIIGHDLKTISKNQGISVEETILNIILESRGRMISFIPDLSEDNIKNQILNNFSLISSNGTGYNLSHAGNRELAHPRCFGAFPRAIKKYVIDNKVISMEDMISKMTSKPAQKIGLKKRGEIKIKNHADIVIFNPQELKDNATIELPYQFPGGINHVIVNGISAVENGNFTGILNGKILKKSVDA